MTYRHQMKLRLAHDLHAFDRFLTIPVLCAPELVVQRADLFQKDQDVVLANPAVADEDAGPLRIDCIAKRPTIGVECFYHHVVPVFV